MKGGGGGVSSYSFPAKRGWRGLAIAVLGLVILSMLVPLVFLLGLHNNFHSSTGYDNQDHRTTTPMVADVEKIEYRNEIRNHDPVLEHKEPGSDLEETKSKHIDDLLKRLAPPVSKVQDVVENSVKGALDKIKDVAQVTKDQKQDHPESHKDHQKSTADTKNVGNAVEVAEHVKGVTGDEPKMSCELEFGSYCLWGREHKEEMKDSMVKQLKDRLFVARAYFPMVAKLPAQQKLSRDMKQNIQEFEKMLSDATTDADLPPHMDKKLQRMTDIVKQAKAFPMDCNYVDKKLRQIFDQTEDEAHFHMKQSAFLYQLAVQTMPKSHHCLSMRLTVEYFRSHSLDVDILPVEKYENPDLHHYVILSKNILSSSVVINSTVMHSQESQNQVFHVVTDGENYYSMRFWFFKNSYKQATVHVVNIEDFNTELQLSLSEEYRVSLRNTNNPTSPQMITEYISLFGPTHFLLPEIFPKLNKVVILDDDIVVQRDLSPLWSLQMDGKVNAALEFCDVRLNQLNAYLRESNYDQSSSCSWMSGLNLIDLVRWRDLNLTGTYSRLLQMQNSKDSLRNVGSFPANLLTFQGLIYGLDSSWALSGLGHNYHANDFAIEKAAVLHYNGLMKPWLELGIRKYKVRWKSYLKRADLYMSECNVNP